MPPKVWRPVPLGDVLEKFLTRLGVTKERVESWTRTKGKPGGCGCAARQKWLNEWGNRVQYRVRAAFLASLRVMHRVYLGDSS